MKRQIIAIGGGGFGRNPGEGIIEKYILEQSDVNKPKVCFIPTATGDDEGYKESYYSTFSMFDCDPVHLDFFKRTPNLESLILNQDIIFVGGGNTKSMLGVWREWNVGFGGGTRFSCGEVRLVLVLLVFAFTVVFYVFVLGCPFLIVSGALELPKVGIA